MLDVYRNHRKGGRFGLLCVAFIVTITRGSRFAVRTVSKDFSVYVITRVSSASRSARHRPSHPSHYQAITAVWRYIEAL